MEALIEKKVLRLYPNGVRFLNGMASSYEFKYTEELEGVISEEDLEKIIGRLNETIQRFWPCTTCLVFGYCCAPCTIFPCFPTNMCIGEAEKQAKNYLRQLSLKATYYDRHITFSLKKTLLSSHVLISFPPAAREDDNPEKDVQMMGYSKQPASLYDSQITPVVKKDT